jgi:hypothetical protein
MRVGVCKNGFLETAIWEKACTSSAIKHLQLIKHGYRAPLSGAKHAVFSSATKMPTTDKTMVTVNSYLGPISRGQLRTTFMNITYIFLGQLLPRSDAFYKQKQL